MKHVRKSTGRRTKMAKILAVIATFGITTSCSTSTSQDLSSLQDKSNAEFTTENDSSVKEPHYFGIQLMSLQNLENDFLNLTEYSEENTETCPTEAYMESSTEETEVIDEANLDSEFIEEDILNVDYDDADITYVEETECEDDLSDYSDEVEEYIYDGPVLTAWNGTIEGPSGRETYYNLDMSGVISLMNQIGYNETYWVRSDGVKMYGEYIMVAADLSIRPRGTTIDTSLGKAIVCDTGGFAASNPYQIDIAVTW